MTKQVLGSIKRLSEYDIEYYGTPSGSYGLVPTCPQHTSRGGQKIFSHKLLSFLCKNQDFFGPCFGLQPITGGKIRQKFRKFFSQSLLISFKKKRKFFEILKIFD